MAGFCSWAVTVPQAIESSLLRDKQRWPLGISPWGEVWPDWLLKGIPHLPETLLNPKWVKPV